MSGNAPLPSGRLTYLFTDIPGSAALWEEAPEAMAAAMARHDHVIEKAVERHGGHVVRPRGEGDGRFAVFAHAEDGLAAAADILQDLGAETWPTPRPIAVRAAIHAGEAELRAGDYYGAAVNRAARLRAIAHPGQMLVSAAAAAGALPDGVGLRDLGLHGLRDIPDPEHVFQLIAPGLPAEFPPLLSLEPARHNLPHQLNDFVGREHELEELQNALRRERLITLVGPPGIGKTRLALQLAATVLDSYREGAWIAELGGLTAEDEMEAAVAKAVGMRAAEGATSPGLAAFLEPKRLLMLFDQIEQPPVFVPELLQAAPAVTVLATARSPLALPGEYVHPVPGLPFPDPTEGLPAEELRRYPAVRLFLDRAHAIRPGFVLDATNAAAVADLCSMLEGVPAALEQAATRLRALSPLQLVERLKRGSLTDPQRSRSFVPG